MIGEPRSNQDVGEQLDHAGAGPGPAKATVTVTVQPLAVDEATAARMLGISLRTFQRPRAEGVTPEPVRLGSCSKPVWPVQALQEWAAASFRDAASMEGKR